MSLQLTLHITTELLYHLREGLRLVLEGIGLGLQLPHPQLPQRLQNSLQGGIGIHGDVESVLHNVDGVRVVNDGSHCSVASRQTGVQGARQREVTKIGFGKERALFGRSETRAGELKL